MTSDRIPTHVPGFLLERLDDSVLLYHPNLAKTIRLNEPAALVWELCDGARSSAEIAELLKAAYPDDHGQIQEDVENTLQRLADEGAIVLA